MKKLAAAMIVFSITVVPLGTVVAQEDEDRIWYPWGHILNLNEEINEPNRYSDLNARGQNNGLDAAPDTWTRILDSIYTPWIPLVAYFGGPIRTYEGVSEQDSERSEIILPGYSMAWAWYGFWNDLDGDGYLYPNNTCEAGCTPDWDNEYARNPEGTEIGPIPPHDKHYGGDMVAYIEPGMHTDVFSNSRPGPTTPDFRYSYLPEDDENDGQYNSPFFIVWYDGSLFQKITWKTVMNATLTPNDSGDPFTCEAVTNCMLDIDVYGAVTDGPVSELYGATLGPIVSALPPVNFAITNTPTPPEEVVAALAPVNKINAPYPGEYTDPRSSAGQLGYAAYVEDYQAWMDFSSRWVSPGAIASFFETWAFGGPKGDDASAIPGTWSGTIYTGVWKDKSLDGIIGVYKNDKWPESENPGSTGNPYYHGWNMDPNNYNDDTGEYFGFFPPDCEFGSEGTATIVVTPEGGNWGNVPVLVVDPFLLAPDTWYQAEGAVTGTASCNANDLALGLWFLDFGLFFPAGNEVAFDVKVEPIDIRYQKGAITVVDSAWDEDTINKFEPLNKAN